MSQPHRKRPGVSRKPKPSVMPILLMLGGVVVLGLTIFLAARGNPAATSAPNFTPEVTGSPKLESDREEVDLGDVRLGQTVEVSFEISNRGDKPLRLSEAPYVEVVEGC